MPSFPWLFEVKENPASDATTVSMPEGFGPESGTIVATEEAKALIAYMKSLKQVSMDAKPSAAQLAKADSAVAAVAKKKINGATIYSNNCAACHQADGQGIQGAFPSLAGAVYVTDNDPTRHIRAVLYGLQNVTIDGKDYSGIMQPFSELLSDEEVAAVINYERTSWGNDAPAISADDVAKVRNNDELKQIQPDE